MTDNLKESLSALIDGEASEIEVHRLLRQVGSDESLARSWVAFMQVRAVARHEPMVPASQQLALSTRISAAIQAEPPHALNRPVTSRRPLLLPAAGMAVAASLVLAVVVSFYLPDGGQAPAEVADTGVPHEAPVQVIESQPAVATSDYGMVDDGVELKELNEVQQRQLRAYLNEHERMARNPNVRTVMFESPQGN